MPGMLIALSIKGLWGFLSGFGAESGAFSVLLLRTKAPLGGRFALRSAAGDCLSFLGRSHDREPPMVIADASGPRLEAPMQVRRDTPDIPDEFGSRRRTALRGSRTSAGSPPGRRGLPEKQEETVRSRR